VSFSPTPRSTLRRKVLVGFGIVSAMIVGIGTISISSTRSFITTADFVTETHEVIETQERLLRDVMAMESSRRGFLVTGEEKSLRGYENSQEEIIQSFNWLRVHAASAAQREYLRNLLELLNQSFALQQEEIELRRTAGADAATTLFKQSRTEAITRKIRSTIVEAEGQQRELLAQRSDKNGYIGRATTFTVIAGGALTVGALVTATIMILRDLGARRRAEEALAQEHNLLSSIINALPNSVYVKDVKGRYILDNNAHREYLALEDIHSIEGKTVYDYFDPAVAARFDADDRQVVATGQPILHREEPALRIDDSERETWLETNKVPLLDTDGKIVGLVGISSDITERKEAEEQLKRFAGQLERSNAELQNFASVASHDLQEPLRKIQAFGDRLSAKCSAQLGEQGRDYLARMQNAAQRMQVLIQDLLKLSRVTSRAQPFERCDLNVIVKEVLSDLEVIIEQSGARIEVTGLPVIDADPLQMRQLFQNLIANAIKFQKPGEAPEISISGRVFLVQEHLIPGAAPGERVCQIHIVDDGIGFDEKFAEQIFVVFQRLHSREEYEGTGIGLAVCRKITDRHGGLIVAKSAVGQGASFIITLPVQQPENPVHE